MNSKSVHFLLRIEYTKEEAVEFIKTVASLKSNEPGSKNQFSDQLDILESDGLRALLGVHPDWVTNERSRLLIAVSKIVAGKFSQHNPGHWVNGQASWNPQNNRCRMPFSLADVVPDFEFIDSFGLRPEVWGTEILKADMESLAAKVNRGEDMEQTNIRLYSALAIFGFQTPEWFFIPKAS